MADLATYPMTITPLARVSKRTDRNGRKFLSFRADVSAAGKASQRTVRCFGPKVDEVAGSLRQGVPVSGRFAYDSFTGEDGSHSQTLRIVSLAA